ncbi:hypothetical protein [Nitrosospira sp. Is2]
MHADWCGHCGTSEIDAGPGEGERVSKEMCAFVKKVDQEQSD